jgi:hypothetical protein
VSIRRRDHRFIVRNASEPCIERKRARAETSGDSLPSRIVHGIDVCNPVAIIEIHKHEIGFAITIQINEGIDSGGQTLKVAFGFKRNWPAILIEGDGNDVRTGSEPIATSPREQYGIFKAVGIQIALINL